MNRFLALMALSVTGLLLFSTAATAWHMPNENEHVKFTSIAGDARVQTDGADCIEAVGHSINGEEKSHCIVLYAHNYDLLQPVPINVQRPPECFPDLAQGFTGTPGIEPFWTFSRAVLYSSAGFVEYEESRCASENYKPRIHPERGLTSDILIDRSADILGYWYLSVDTAEFTPAGQDGHNNGLNMGVMPCVTVEMVLQTGRFPGSGTTLATGRTTKTMVTTPDVLGDAPDLPAQPPDPCEGSDGDIAPGRVTEFKVNLGKATADIPEHAGYIIIVRWFQHDGGNSEEENNVIMREWNRHNGADYPNRVIIPVQESIRIERIRVQEFDSKLYFHTVLNSPWGSYDVDTRNIRVEVFKENGEAVPLQHLAEPILRYSVDHDGHFKPVNATFPWDYKKENLPDGRYTVKVTVPNWQHTAEATRSSSFGITASGVESDDDERPPPIEEESPMGALLVTSLALFAALGIALRRRR
jgi:hypothetical protein